MNIYAVSRPLTCAGGTLEYMASQTQTKARTGIVVRNSSYPQFCNYRIVISCIASILALVLSISVLPYAVANEQDASTDTSINVTSNITDPQNLLGTNLSKVSDAIDQTHEKTGAIVRLLYLPSFNSTEKPEQWAGRLLDSLNPKPNTVLLAVASNDGSLAVAVSSNSDEWLKKQSTVDKLSDAALKPIIEHDGQQDPNWTQSAIDMMDEIQTIKQTSTAGSISTIGIISLVIVLVLLCAFAVLLFILHKNKKGRHSH